MVMGLDFADDTREFGVMHSLKKMMKITKLIQPILQEFDGEVFSSYEQFARWLMSLSVQPIEDTIFKFNNTTNCLRAALEIKAAFIHLNANTEAKNHVPFVGFGIHRVQFLGAQCARLLIRARARRETCSLSRVQTFIGKAKLRKNWCVCVCV